MKSITDERDVHFLFLIQNDNMHFQKIKVLVLCKLDFKYKDIKYKELIYLRFEVLVMILVQIAVF